MASKIEKYRIGLVGVQEIRWEGNVTLEVSNYTLFHGESKVYKLGSIFFFFLSSLFVNGLIRSTVKRVKCIMLKGRWCDIVTVHAPSKVKDVFGLVVRVCDC